MKTKTRRHHKILLLLLIAAMAVTLLPIAAQAAQGSDFAVTGDPAGYTYGADGKLTFIAPGDYTVSMATPGSSTTTDTIVVNVYESSTVNPVSITLQDVSIDVSGTSYACAFDVKDGSTVSLTLSGTNTLTSGHNTAGLHVPSGAALFIGGDGTLYANGGGGINISVNDGGAGIGSSTNENSGVVTITGGTIFAEGAQYSAGIGGGYYGTNGTVNISGGTVTANGKNGSAGIGGGSRGGSGTINITGGTVNATGYNTGIGSGSDGSGGTINISDGTVTATGMSWGSGIGSGPYYTGTDITIMISGGTVNATASTHGAGIGGGFRGSGGTILITGGTVTAQGGKYGAGIGGGRYDSWAPDSYGYNITISGGMINATGGQGGAGIGGGFDGKDGVDVSGGTITISGGTITAVGGDAVDVSSDMAPTSAGGGAGIGGGCNGGGGNVYISGGSVKAVHGVCTGTGTSAEDIGKGYAGVGDGILKNFDTAEGVDVYLTELTLGGVSAATAVSSIITDAAYTYGTSGMQTDSGGKLYLYLPAGKKTTAAVTLPSASTYTGEVMTTTDPATSRGTLSPSADVSTYAEFTTAVADANIGTINVIGSFALEGDVTIDRAVTITSANGSVIAAGSHSLLVSGAAADVTLSGDLTVIGSSTVISVGANSKFTLTGGSISASGNNSRGIFVQSKGVAYINGGSVSATGENAYGILLGWAEDGMANLYIDMSNTPSIDEVYYLYYGDTISFLTSFPAPFSAVLGETKTVTLTGGVEFGVRTIWAGSPGTSLELNAANVPPDDNNTFSVTPNAVGTYSLVLLGSTYRSNTYIIIPVTVTSGFAGGDGTAGNPFRIANIEQLNRVRKFLGSAHTNKYFVLTANIDLGVAPYNTGEGWEPIGNNVLGTDNMFQGNFNGNGKTISGLFIDRTDDLVGLFGACSDANIQNLALSGVNITSNDNDAGSLAGYLCEASAVTNCYATGTVTSRGNLAGGLVGVVSSSTITNSYATCSVAGNTAGGLVGGIGGTSSITNSYAAGSVTGTYFSGGLVGNKLGGGTVTASYYNSQTSGKSDNDGRGEPKTSIQLVQEATFSGWDFTEETGDWDISEGVSYPYLQVLVPASLPAPPALTGITVAPENLTLTYGGDTATLTPSLVGPAGTLIPVITWSSSNTSVATVSDGEVTPVGAGDATITASIAGGTISDTAAVKVNKRTLTIGGSFTSHSKQYDGTTTASIDINNLTLNGIVGSDTVTLNASAVFDDANVGTGKTVSLAGSTLMGTDAGNYQLSFAGAPTATANITKTTGIAAPDAPTLLDKTDTSVTLTPNATLEFRVDGALWQDSNVFTDLSPSTTYTFTARIKETANSEASAESAGLLVTTYDITYAVTYLPNGGSGTAPTETNKPEGASFTVKSNTFTAPSGKRFKEWNTEANGSGTAYAAGATVVMPAAALTLHAIWENVSSSTGGGSGGRGTSISTYTASVSTGGSIPITVDTKTADASLDLSSLSGGQSDGESIIVTMPSMPGVNSVTATFSASTLSGSGEGTLTLNTGIGNIILPSDMLSGTGLTGEAGVTIGTADTSSLPDDVKAAIGDRPVIQLTLTIDGEQTDWSNPNAPVTVSIPYTPTAAELANPESIVVWYIDGSGNVVTVPNGRYDAATGMVTFETTHFSHYAVAYNKVSFNDVSASAWYSKAVSFVAAREISKGTGGGKYSPEAKLTRGEFIVLMMRAYGIAPDANPQNNFADAGSTYYTGYLAAAKRLGITAGAGNNMYAPGNHIARQEMFTLLYNALKIIDRLPYGVSGKQLSNFLDSGSVAVYAQDAMAYMVQAGIASGSNGYLFPASTTTRAQMAQVLYNLLGK